MRLSILKAGFIGAALFSGIALQGLAQAQGTYPHKQVTLVTHSSPGGGSDVFLRDLAKHLGPVMGVNFTVENVSGGSGAKAMAYMAKAKADGSVFYATTPTYIQTTLLSAPQFGYQSLEPVAIIFEDPQVVFTRAEAPYQSLSDVVQHSRSNPGKQRWGAANPASLERITLERIMRKAGLKVAVVPHEGGGDMMINVLNGTLDIGVGELQELQAQLEARKVRVLAVVGEKRIAMLPNVPTAREQGVDVAVRKFRGLAAPKGVPKQTTKALEEGLRKVLVSPEYKKSYAEGNLIPILLGHEEAIRFTNEFAEDITQNMKELGLVK